MRPAVTASVVLAATLLCPAAAVAEIPWVTDVQRIRREAPHLNRPVLLDFWASWCGPCNAMDTQVFSQERVAIAMRKVVPVRIDVDRHADMERKYRVAATPTLIVTDGYGNELFRHTGMLAADQLIAVLDALPADLTRINALAAFAAQNDQDAAVLASLGDELRAYGLYLASSDHYRRGLKTRAGRERTELRARMLLWLGRNQAAVQATREAERTLLQLLREFPAHPEAAAVKTEIDALRHSRQAPVTAQAAPPSAARHTGVRPAGTSTPRRART